MKLSLSTLTKIVFKDMRRKDMLEDIIERATRLNIKFSYNDKLDGMASFILDYDPQIDDVKDILIQIRPEVPKVQQVIAVAHEMGHAWQYLGECEADWMEWCLYRTMNSDLLVERDAWLRSIAILKEVNFTEWSHFMSLARRAYESYVIHCDPHGVMSDFYMKQFEEEIGYEMKIREVVYVSA